MKFEELNISESIKRSLKEMNYTTPSPIQEMAIPYILEGRDVLGCAQTGTGKTCAFMVPMINSFITNNHKGIKGLILTPTRELALQIYENTKEYSKYTKVRSLAIFGGVKEGKQKDDLRKGIDILIATPGRLLDFIEQGIVNIKNIEFFVLDEADRMLDMGFIHDVKRVVKLIPKNRQTLLFSATMPESIKELCNQLLDNPATVTITPSLTTVERIDQAAYLVDKENKPLLLRDLLKNNNIYRALVFVRTKHGCDKLCKQISKYNIKASAIHGNKSQNARQKALQDFKDGKIQVLCATDIAARGIDIDDLECVINYDLPDVEETYVHRIGRTARAGKSGIAYSFACYDELDMLKSIEKSCKITLDRPENNDYPMKNFTKKVTTKPQRGQSQRGNSSKNGNISKPSNTNSLKKENSSFEGKKDNNSKRYYNRKPSGPKK